MSRNQRIGLLVAALVVAVVAVAIAVASGGGGDTGDQAAQTTEPATQAETETGAAEQPHETVPPKPAIADIEGIFEPGRLRAARAAPRGGRRGQPSTPRIARFRVPAR